MSNTNETLEKQFKQRYTSLKLFDEFLLGEIQILESLSDPTAADSKEKIQKVMSNLSEHEISSEEFREAKQIADSFINGEISYSVANARLNYLYDLASFKASHMLLIYDIFQCYF